MQLNNVCGACRLLCCLVMLCCKVIPHPRHSSMVPRSSSARQRHLAGHVAASVVNKLSCATLARPSGWEGRALLADNGLTDVPFSMPFVMLGKFLCLGFLGSVLITQGCLCWKKCRYSLHWHMHGDVAYKQYLRGAAVHHTYNRATTLHGVHSVLIQNNVAFNVMGKSCHILRLGLGSSCALALQFLHDKGGLLRQGYRSKQHLG